MKLLAISILALCSGCATHNLTTLATQLKDDPATVVGNINTIYGTGKLIRTSPRSDQDVTIAPDGTVTIRGHGRKE